MLKKIFIICIVNFFVVSLYGSGYKIDIHIKGAKNTEVYLAVHYGESRYVRDTAFLNDSGKGSFVSDKPLDGGMYLLAINGTHILDFLISDSLNQKFSIETEKDKYTSTLKFKNSPENSYFAEMTRFLAEKNKKEKDIIDNPAHTKEEMKVLHKNLEKEFDAKLDEINKQFPNSLLYSLMHSMKPYETGDYDVPSDVANRDSLLYIHYYNLEKDHFWDNFDLKDKRLLNSPILMPAMDRYFMQMLVKLPDSIITPINKFLSKAEGNKEMMLSLTAHLFNSFINSDIMGMESVVVYIIDNYYTNGKVAVNDDKFLKDVQDFADKNRPTLIGQPAPKLEMENVIGQLEKLADIKSPYTLVYFFETNCGHCKKITPKVYDVYNKFKSKGLAAYCVYTQDNKDEWIEYIATNNLEWTNVWDPTNVNNFRVRFSIYSVPIIYLLDSDKKIIGRRLGPESLEKMLEHLIDKK